MGPLPTCDTAALSILCRMIAPRPAKLTTDFITIGNIITDLMFTFGPLVHLRNVKVSRYNKWALRAVFLVDLIASACAIAKCTELPKLSSTQDPTYDAFSITV